MLVLSRKKGEKIRINDDITLVVVEIRGDKVRLGVEAPTKHRVHREEVYEAIRRLAIEGDVANDGAGQGTCAHHGNGTEAAPSFEAAHAALGGP